MMKLYDKNRFFFYYAVEITIIPLNIALFLLYERYYDGRAQLIISSYIIMLAMTHIIYKRLFNKFKKPTIIMFLLNLFSFMAIIVAYYRYLEYVKFGYLVEYFVFFITAIIYLGYNIVYFIFLIKTKKQPVEN